MVRLKPTLTDVLTADRPWFGQFGESMINDLPTRHLFFKDNGANILGVGHIDTVEDHRTTDTEVTLAAHDTAMKLAKFQQTGPQLDDRLGVWALLSVLPDSMNFDLLLTDNEEIGMSTALEFIPPEGKKYNWIFELDRRGDGCVLYQYGSKKWNRELERAGFRIDKGSFSDIGYLDHLGVQAVNIGVGYNHEHTLACDWDINITRNQIQKLITFYTRNKDKRYAYSHSRTSFAGGRAWAGHLNSALHKPISQMALSSYEDDFDLYSEWGAETAMWNGHTTQPKHKTKEELLKIVNGREYLYNGFSWAEVDSSKFTATE
jgi:hypothetical protein